MPTENRSTIVVPRELLERIDRMYTDGMSIFGECEDVRALLAEPAQHQGEPVAYLCKAEGAKWLQYSGKVGAPWKPGEVEVTPLYSRPAPAVQGEPVALVEVGADRNARVTVTDQDWLRGLKDKASHQVVPLYTHADPGEVERLRLERRRMDQALVACANERDTLRAQLAEAHGLLRELDDAWNSHDGKERFYKLMAKIESLSASAEPSAPVERDERAAYDAWRHSESGYVRHFSMHEWSAWQARAALERKPQVKS